MTLPQISKTLTSLYNTLGNKWIVDNLKSDPFVFKVFVRKGDHLDLTDYVIEVYSDRPIPRTIPYRDPLKQPSRADGIHHSVLARKFKELTEYVDRFGELGKTLGVDFMDLSRN